jgi:hypothetical protein
MEFAVARQRLDLSQCASNRRTAYVVLMSLTPLALAVAQGSRDGAVVMAIALIVCTLSLLYLILRLIYQVKHELA